jgi:DNA adenine methylase
MKNKKHNHNQKALFPGIDNSKTPPPQLLKWVGNKQRYAHIITSFLPDNYNKYIEPFMGTGAILAAMNPSRGLAGDTLKPLIDIMKLVKKDSAVLIDSYEKHWIKYNRDPKGYYLKVRESYNNSPNALDLLFLSRSCYGGVVRFTRAGKMSTPIGPHRPIPPNSFAKRALDWAERIKNVDFICADYKETMSHAKENDVVYCDPPYVDSQSILYGAQTFNINELFEMISKSARKGAKVALSIDGSKKSGKKVIMFDFPDGLFKRELIVDNGSSMLRRFQKSGENMDGEFVKERLLLTW